MDTQIHATAYRTTKVILHLILDTATIDNINQRIHKRLKDLHIKNAFKKSLSEEQLLNILLHPEERTDDILKYIAYDVMRQYLLDESIMRQCEDTGLVLQDGITVMY